MIKNPMSPLFMLLPQAFAIPPDGAAAVRTAVPAGQDVPTVFLHAGDIFSSADPTRATTILGSCVSTCIFDSIRGIGGMNHFVLPQRGAGGGAIGHQGETAIAELVNALLTLGAERRNLRAKVLGGGNVLPAGGTSARRSMDIGRRNVNEAFRVLRLLRIPVLGEYVQQYCGLNIEMLTSTGSVQVRHLGGGQAGLSL